MESLLRPFSIGGKMILPAKHNIARLTFAIMLIGLLLMTIPYAKGQTNNPPTNQTTTGDTANDSAVVKDPVELYLAYLRANFDDIHDVIMRFHLSDPKLRGQAVLRMIWKDGRLDSASVVDNDTGNKDFGPALIEAMRKWEIPALIGPSEITIPFATKIVGSDDPEFDKRAILTGTVSDNEDHPLAGVKVMLLPGKETDFDPITIRTNREGVYIRTLIPPGEWDLTCSLEGYKTAMMQGIILKPGTHKRIDFDLQPVKPSE
jgi:hypothetical protein